MSNAIIINKNKRRPSIEENEIQGTSQPKLKIPKLLFTMEKAKNDALKKSIKTNDEIEFIPGTSQPRAMHKNSNSIVNKVADDESIEDDGMDDLLANCTESNLIDSKVEYNESLDDDCMDDLLANIEFNNDIDMEAEFGKHNISNSDKKVFLYFGDDFGKLLVIYFVCS